MNSAKYYDSHLALSAAVDNTAESFSVEDVNKGYLQVSWSGLSAVTAVLKLQSSVDGVFWDDVPTASITLDSAAGSKSMQLTEVLYPRVRAVYTKNTESSGTFSSKAVFKSTK